MNASKSLILSALLILLSAIAASAERPLFANLDNVSDVSRVYISSALLKKGLSQTISTANDSIVVIGGNSASGMADKLNYIEVISSDTKNGAQLVKREFRSFLNETPDMELIMTTSDGDGEKTSIYARSSDQSSGFAMIIICAESDDDEVSLTIMSGDIDATYFSAD